MVRRVDMSPRMRRLLGRVSALRGVDAAVGLGNTGGVLVVLDHGGGSTRRELDLDAVEARGLAARLREAADAVDGRGAGDPGAPSAGRSPGGRFEVRAQWPTVAVWLRDPAGALEPGLDFTPGNARLLAALLRQAADATQP